MRNMIMEPVTGRERGGSEGGSDGGRERGGKDVIGKERQTSTDPERRAERNGQREKRKNDP